MTTTATHTDLGPPVGATSLPIEATTSTGTWRPDLPIGATPVPPEAMTDLEVWPDGDPRKFWTPGEMAYLLWVPKSTVYDMRKAGLLGAVKCGRGFRFPDRELVRLSRAASNAVDSAA
jgi:excisionase family DNA binding protein